MSVDNRPLAPSIAAPSHALYRVPAEAPELAGLGERLVAKLIDLGTFALPLVSVLMFARGEWRGLGAALAHLLGLVLWLPLAGTSTWWLHTRGQTIGKRVMQIRIVRSDGRRVPFFRLLAHRVYAIQLLRFVPIFGGLMTVIVMVFDYLSAAGSDERQAIHDVIADTIVVKCRPESQTTPPSEF